MSRPGLRVAGGFGLVVVCLVGTSFASSEEVEDRFADEDLDNAVDINEVCAGCHGEYEQGGKDGECPRLAGLPAGFIARQLELFRSRERANLAMVEHTDHRQMPDSEVRDISVFLAAIALPSRLPPASG